MTLVTLSLALAGVWLFLALFLPSLSRRSGILLWVVVLSGIPVLGWLTYHCGPIAGMVAMAIGVILMCWPPLRRREAGKPQSLRHPPVG